MDSYSDNDAKTQFGQLLMKAQRGPVQINKNGKPVAVLISMEKFEMTRQFLLKIDELMDD
jgi:prevent-host-death family protein